MPFKQPSSTLEVVLRLLGARLACGMDLSAFPAEDWGVNDAVQYLVDEIRDQANSSGHCLSDDEVNQLQAGLSEGFALRPGHFQR